MGTLHRFENKARKARRGPRRAADARGWLASAREIGPILIALPLAAFCAVWFAGQSSGGPPAAGAVALNEGLNEGLGKAGVPPALRTVDAHFAPCGMGRRVTCVVDGGTIWIDGEKIRLADINTPETSDPACTREARLGARATARLTALLNEAPFALAPNPDGRDEDRYGRKLRLLIRGGTSLGTTLVREGLAEEWRGVRRAWC